MCTFETKHVYANGLSFLTAVAGSGPKLVFLTGTNSDLRNQNSPINSVLCEHFTVLSFDQRGMGQSDKPDKPYSMMDYAEDTIAIIDAFGWQQVYLAGYSFGGMVAQEIAINWPHRVSKLALLATTAGGAGGSSYPIEQFEPLPAIKRARERLSVIDLSFTAAWQQANTIDAQARIEQFMSADTQYMHEAGYTVGRQRQLAARATHNTFNRLDNISAPTLVLAGNRDGQALETSQRAMASKIPHCTFELLDGSHQMIAENEQVYKMLSAFFHA